MMGVMKNITITYWKWTVSPLSPHGEPRKALSISPFGRWGNQDLESSGDFPRVHTTEGWPSRDAASGLLGISAWALKKCAILSESIPPSLILQLLISLILWKRVLTVPHSTEVSAVGSFSSDLKCVSVHSPHLNWRFLKAMDIRLSLLL